MTSGSAILLGTTNCAVWADDAATAADTAAPVEAAEGGDAASGVAIVVVTSQRREENIQQVPIPITAIDGNTISEAGLTSAVQVGNSVPNFSVERNNGHGLPRWNLRGLYTGDPSATTVSPVGVYYDDVYVANVSGANRPLYDLERVEVLRGPQGTLWGKNTTGGALNFISRKPTFTPDGFAKLDAGNFNLLKFEGALSGPLVADRVAARVSLYRESLDGYGVNSYEGRTRRGQLVDQAARFQVQAVLNDDADILVSAYTRRYTAVGQLGRATRFGTAAGGADQQGFIGTPLVSSADIESAKVRTEQPGANVRLTWKLGDLDFVSISAYDDYETVPYGDSDSDGGPYDLQRTIGGSTGQSSRQLSQELRLASPRTDRWNWIVGAHYFQEDASQWGATGRLPGPQVPTTQLNRIDMTQEGESYAVFASQTYSFTPKLSLSAGVRWSSETKKVDLLRTLTNNVTFTDRERWWLYESVVPPASGFVVAAIQNDRKTWSDYTLDITPQYEITDNARVYLRYARGFLSGGFNGNAAEAGAVGVVNPEYLKDYELGFKSEWLDNRLVFNVNAFYYDYDDIQTNITSLFNNSYVSRRTNGAAAKVYGTEWELSLAPTRNLRTYLAYATLHTEYTDYRSGTDDFTGYELGRSPKYSAILGLNYRIPLSNGNAVVLDTSWHHRDKQLIGNTNLDPFYTAERRTMGSVRLSYWLRDADLRVTAWSDNVTDELYASNASPGGYSTRNRTYVEPRTYGLSITKQFY